MIGQVDGSAARVKPAVIIGIGGSGDWVLREIKAAFLRVGRVPPSIQFVGIDTAPPADQVDAGQRSSTGGGDGDDDPFRVPPLAPNETIRLNDNLKRMCDYVQTDAQQFPLDAVDETDGSLPHLRGWLRAGEYLQKLSEGTFVLFDGEIGRAHV